MGLRRRIRKAEERAYGGPEPPCHECGGRIILEEVLADGTRAFRGGGPCETCGSHGDAATGKIGRITIDLRDPKDVPEDDGSTVEWPP